MLTAYVVVAVLTMVACAWSAAADLARVQFVLANCAEVGVPQSWLPPLAALKAAGVAGLLLGLLGVPVVGLAAATGLVLFFVGAVTAHLRARVFHNMGYAGGFLALTIACLVLDVAVEG
ncbi:DoxX family protein [Plantactinospora sp. B6F1]|uniref:DoxX family protein n=1 Tax=Plantactinospora sp. B6F1 TaxID=3158971 RepID=UPI00102CE052